MIHKRILITSPSLDVRDNVSGISTLVKSIMNNSSFKIQHFKLGSKDSEAKDLLWLVRQVMLVGKFFLFFAGNKYDVLHSNTSLEKFSIIRDYLMVFLAKKLFGKKILL